MPAFAATRAMFENASFASGSASSTPVSKRNEVTSPSRGYVKEMRAKREAASGTPEISSPPPVSV